MTKQTKLKIDKDVKDLSKYEAVAVFKKYPLIGAGVPDMPVLCTKPAWTLISRAVKNGI